MSEVAATGTADTASGDQGDDQRPVRQVSSLVARQTYQGLITVMAFLPPLPSLPVLGVDLKSGRKIQADNEQIRHHDTSDDEHAAAGSECPHRMADRAGLPSRPVVGVM
jgi:hypothetical protein